MPGFFIVALGCKSYKCAERKDFETPEGTRWFCDVWGDADSVNVIEIVIVGVVSK